MKRAIDIAIELVFVILVMMIVAVIVIKMFTQQSQAVQTLANTQQQQLISYCQQQCQNGPLYFCSATYDVGPGMYKISGAIEACGKAVPCPIATPDHCTYNGYNLYPIVCYYLECQNLIQIGLDPASATYYTFGTFSSNGGMSTITFNGTNPVQLSYQNGGYIPTGIDECYQIPNWLQYEMANPVSRLVEYFNTQNGCSISVTTQSTTVNGNQVNYLAVTGTCPQVGLSGTEPLCSFLLAVPLNELYSVATSAS